ncbi:hypothetical protein quinque_001191 [Culex quinquefasciatus]
MLVVGMSSEQLFNNISRALANPAKLFRVMATVMPVVVTNDPDMTQRILTSPDCLEKAFLYKFFRLDSGLFAANYDLWKAQRKAINPTFNLKILHKFIPLFDNEIMLLTLALLAGLWIATYVCFRLRYRFADRIPTVTPFRFFFGNGLEFYRKNSYEIFNVLCKPTRDQHRIFKLCFGPIQVLCPAHPDLIQQVLCGTASMEKPQQYRFLRINFGLLASKCR